MSEIFKPKKGDLTVSHSALTEFLTCRKKYEYAYEHLRKPKVTALPLIIGVAFHAGVAALYTHESEVLAIKAVRDDFHVFFEEEGGFMTADQEAELEAARNMTIGMVKGYAKIYKSDMRGLQLIDVEQTFTIPIQGYQDTYFVGKIDLLVRKKKGSKREVGLWIVEHKTAGRIDSHYIRRLPIDRQVTGYIYGGSLYYEEPIKGVIYNVVKKCGYRQKKGENPAAFQKRVEQDYLLRPETNYYRQQVLRSVRDLKLFEEELDAMVMNIVGCKEGIEQYYRNTSNCMQFFHPCFLMDVCLNGEKPELVKLHTSPKRFRHEELEELYGQEE